MADKLKFSLVSPERELYSGDVDQVDMPGTEGDLGILPNHSPLMAALSTGLITVYKDGVEDQYFVQGGFADVTPAGLTILAERSVHMDELDHDDLRSRIERAQKQVASLEGDAHVALSRDIDAMLRILGGKAA
ncbi:F0F1 ATP synthase subunit epsilon [Litorimonas sp. WD9-15]|uniref:F0F1 ATP synthase subunit epsilon n=1 Tax=Litorimonas sp. WD9-15 TaxID=3418716 RepID=UPI003D0414E8